jgi:hypothetical protein
MSSVIIQGNASGTGSVTVESPNTNSDYTLTLPAETGTILTNATAGTVLQVVQATYATEVQVASTSYTDTGLSASITPTSATSKVLIVIAQQAETFRSTNSQVRGDFRILNESTAIFTQVGVVGLSAGTPSSGTLVGHGMYSGVYLDSPATTSSVTYKTQAKLNTTSDSALLQIQGGGTSSSITLLEIAA